ncbi:MAG: hypothetical protein AAFV85_05605 [Cyanobacteria bacterium J06634_6]
MTFQEVIDSIESLSEEDQDLLFELIQKRRVEARRSEIAANAKEALQAVETDTAHRGNFEATKAYLLSDDDE